MISEREFVKGFTGFWGQAVPLLTPQVVTKLNAMAVPLDKGLDMLRDNHDVIRLSLPIISTSHW